MVLSLDKCISTAMWVAESNMAIRLIQSLSTAFLNSGISQGSVPTLESVMEYSMLTLLQIYQGVSQWKNYENRLAFGEVTDKSVGTRFYWSTL